MNILPKKRWHVRTRENIARVRKDEAAAAEEEKKRIEKIELADKEARTEILRTKARNQYGYVPKKEEPKKEAPIFGENGHVNLFYELENNSVVSNKTNAEHEKEVKEEREKEEMKIGYLTYLGQDTNELTGNVSWYNKLPSRLKVEDGEIGLKDKLNADPLKNIRTYLSTEGIKEIVETPSAPLVRSTKIQIKKHKKKKCSDKYKREKEKRKKRKKEKKREKKKKEKRKRRSSSSSNEDTCKVKVNLKSFDIEKMRKERLMREQIERKKADSFLAKLRGEPETKPPDPIPTIIQKYNSQFNPSLARQNFPN